MTALVKDVSVTENDEQHASQFTEGFRSQISIHTALYPNYDAV